ncbi:hypothetical protein BD410DRAFT_840169 [Rickenella mellea]|uniref:Peptidase C14 caspase domain-containing protein n=1 Tax=Rickenella mellea TaxID=50990 RepID=A0A4Y7Q3Z8_9AGAM|nr:hypothetical protein BD410DRAFT_840169 [Rickenella mellea]
MKSIGSAQSVFALVIGINKYEIHDTLEGAVADADAFARFLVEGLGVDNDHVMNLRDEAAKKADIVSAFESLKSNAKIQSGDAIIIYFSGHGARTPVPTEWTDWESNESQIEMICPVDIGSTPGEDGIEIGGIPDRMVGIWLNELSKEKGNNIALIMDCCHSASATRDPNCTGLVPRQILNPPAIIVKDWHVSSQSRGAAVAPGFGGQNQESHVLLAACGREELAWENPKTQRGLFTTALLEALSESDLCDLTYNTLFRKIHIPVGPPQTPHCYGRHIGRRLFNGHATGADPSFVFGYKRDDGTIILDAGGAHGVQLSSRYSLYRNNVGSSLSNPHLGFLVVHSITPNTSILVPTKDSPSFEIPSKFCARDARNNPYRTIVVYCKDQSKLEAVLLKTLERANIRSLEATGIVFVDNVKSADLSISFEDNEVVFYRKESTETAFIAPRIRRTIPVDDSEGVFRVLRASANFNAHLNTTSTSAHPISDNMVTMEFQKLDGKWSDEYKWVVTPTGPNLIANEQVDMVVDSNVIFGVTIHNHTDSPLYPYLFYFDGSDFGIQVWYVPPVGIGGGRNLDAPLSPNAKFPIGYGDGGALPWAFHLPNGENKDIGFLKLYVTDSPSDFANISQGSPFDDADARQLEYPIASAMIPSNIFSTKTVTILQRREGTPPPILKTEPPNPHASGSHSRITIFVILVGFLLYPTFTALSLLCFCFCFYGHVS